MLMPASAEFVALCQAQVTLLTQSLGAALSIVYLTEELTELTDAKLVPVVAYPEAIATWGEERTLSLLSRRSRSQPPLLPGDSSSDSTGDSTRALTAIEGIAAYSPVPTAEKMAEKMAENAAEAALMRQQQVVLPLIHEGVVMGLLITARSDRAWNEAEQSQIQEVAETLAVACVLDQRSQWMAQDLRQQRALWEQRQDLFDDLLHQFRNPLTALRTFGKLLMKRLQPGDANHTVADGIVRESDRLQDLLKQLDLAADLDSPPLLPASTATHETPLLPDATHYLTGAPQLAPHSVTEVLAPLLETAAAIAQDRSLTLHTLLPTDLPLVHTDLRMLREVLSNLIDNALKYTPAGGEVWVWVLQEQPSQRQIIGVADTGKGIPAEDLPRLFERHYRGVQAQSEIPGTGLGLAIARELLQGMGAAIEIFSPAAAAPSPLPGDYPATAVGTAVLVSLPLA
jgi:signal transduction histidine kinase